MCSKQEHKDAQTICMGVWQYVQAHMAHYYCMYVYPWNKRHCSYYKACTFIPMCLFRAHVSANLLLCLMLCDLSVGMCIYFVCDYDCYIYLNHCDSAWKFIKSPCAYRQD